MFKKSCVICAIVVLLGLPMLALLALPVSAAVTPIFQESFESSLSNWTIISGSPTITTTAFYRGRYSLLMNYLAPPYVMLQHNMTPITNILVRVFFYDKNKDQTLDSMFEVKTSGSLTTPGPHMGLGVDAGSPVNNYKIRIGNTGSHTVYDTGITRTTGWHMFEVIVTPAGAYAKIDNEFISAYPHLAFVSAGSIDFVSTHDVYGQSNYDELIVVPADTAAWQTQFYDPPSTHTNTYRGTNFSPIYTPTPGVPPTLCDGNNALRTLIDTATTLYRYGKFANDTAAWSRGVALYKDALNYGHYNDASCIFSDSEWMRGVTGSSLAYASYIMWNDLDATTQNKAASTLYSEAGTFIKAKDGFEASLSGWTIDSRPPNSASIRLDLGHGSSKSLQLILANPSDYVVVSRTVAFSSRADTRSSVARTWFYDDMDQTLGTSFGVKSADGQYSTSLGVNTSIVASSYIFRYKNPSGGPYFVNTGIARSAGWHKFELFVNNWSADNPRPGTFARIDGTLVGTTHPNQTDIGFVEFVSTWGLTGQATYDDVFVSRMPESGYVNDTKAEENAWQGDFLAVVTNFFPNVPNRAELEWLGRCYAWHSITRSTDPDYCGIKTRTADDSFNLYNHGVLNPTYALSTLRGLGRGGMSYVKKGAAIPTEFQHNVGNLYTNFILPHLDLATFQFKNLPAPLDWCGATNSGYLGVVGYQYARYLGVNVGFTFNDMMAKRSVFYYNISSDYVKDPLPQLSSFGWEAKKCPIVGRDSYDWFLNTNFAGNDYAIAGYLFQ